jgi:hypothetical protein
MYDTTNNIGLVQAMIAGTGTSPLCLNAAGGNVGIGVTNPSNKLSVNSSTAILPSQVQVSHGGGDWGIVVKRNSADVGSANFAFLKSRDESGATPIVQGDNIGRIAWHAVTNGTGPVVQYLAEIGCLNTTFSGGNADGSLLFWTKQTTDINPVERVRILANGNVGIGNTTPPIKLWVPATSTTTGIGVYNSDVALIIGNAAGGTNSGSIQVKAGGSSSAIGATNYRLALNPDGGNVGIGTVSSGYKLQVDAPDTTTAVNAAFFQPGLSTGGNFTHLFIGQSAGPSRCGAISFGNYGTNTTNVFQLSLNSAGGSTINITTTGVGIGTVSPAGGLHVRTTTQVSLYTEQYSGVGNQGSVIQCWNTNIFCAVLDNQMTCGWSSNRWTTVYATTGTINTSDSRQKMNISPSNLGLNFISNLNPVSYSWIDGGTPATEPNVVGARPGKRTFYGFLAQDVKKTLDAMGTGDFAGWTLDDPKDPDSTQGLRYTEFIAPMVKAIKELSSENTALKQSLASATARLDSLESRLAAAGI